MSDDPRRDRRERDHDPVTTGELARWVERSDREQRAEHREIRRILERQDERITSESDRTDRLSTRVTVIFSVVAVLWSVFLVRAPFIRAVLGLPNG